MSAALEALERLEWDADRVVLGDLVLRLRESEGAGGLQMCKGRRQIDQYADLLRRLPGFSPENIFELGILDGGSTAFWFELFRPRKLVAVDFMSRGDSEDFRAYIASRDAEERIATFWSVDQSDKARLRELVAESFDGPLDLVIDDASHLYTPTKASFEALFPLLAPGGLYVVEDWAWGHVSRYREDHQFAGETPLTELLVEIVRAVGSAPDLVRRIHVCPAFFAVERGPEEISDPPGFSLDELLARMR